MLRVFSSVITTVILVLLFSFAARFIGREKQQAEQNRVRLSILFYKLGRAFAVFFLAALLCLYVLVEMPTHVFIAVTFSFGVLAGTGFLFMAMYRNWRIEYDESGIRYRSHFGRRLAFGYGEIKKIKQTPTGIVLHVNKKRIIVDYRTIGFEQFLQQIDKSVLVLVHERG